jgi:putative ABC transport system substrate-binding protein
MKIPRRHFLATLAGAAASPMLAPLSARAQQSAIPVVGFLDTRPADSTRNRMRGFRQGLRDNGFVEGDNVTIAYRSADNQSDRLPELALELVRRRVAVIATAGDHVAPVAKAATTTIPVVFIVAQDPVKLGLVATLARPSGNVTGINFFSGELSAKRLGLLHELVPAATRVAVLVDPDNAQSAESTVRDLHEAARVLRLQLDFLNASNSGEIDAAFATIVRESYGALLVSSDPFFSSRHVQLVTSAIRHAIPTSFPQRESVESGGLMSYASNIVDVWRQSGDYVGRILKGAKPADLPVVQSSKFQLVINAHTARLLGLTVPPSILSVADEVIE